MSAIIDGSSLGARPAHSLGEMHVGRLMLNKNLINLVDLSIPLRGILGGSWGGPLGLWGGLIFCYSLYDSLSVYYSLSISTSFSFYLYIFLVQLMLMELMIGKI